MNFISIKMDSSYGDSHETQKIISFMGSAVNMQVHLIHLMPWNKLTMPKGVFYFGNMYVRGKLFSCYHLANLFSFKWHTTTGALT